MYSSASDTEAVFQDDNKHRSGSLHLEVWVSKKMTHLNSMVFFGAKTLQQVESWRFIKSRLPTTSDVIFSQVPWFTRCWQKPQGIPTFLNETVLSPKAQNCKVSL